MPESTQKEILSFVLPDEASTELLGKRLAEAVLKHSKEITDRGLNIRLQGTGCWENHADPGAAACARFHGPGPEPDLYAGGNVFCSGARHQSL